MVCSRGSDIGSVGWGWLADSEVSAGDPESEAGYIDCECGFRLVDSGSAYA